MELLINAEILGKAAIEPPVLMLPLYETVVSAGFPSPADDFLDKSLDLNELLVEHPISTFFVRVRGDSMMDAGIFPNDILIVDRSLEPKDNSIVIAVLDGDFTVKRFRIDGKTGYLMPANKSYSAIPINGLSDFLIWGVVTFVIHKPK